ncbi:MAG: MBG domain-containing protein, partial [Bacillota bacterium]
MKRKKLPIIALLIILLLSVIIGATACGEEKIPVERIALTSLPQLEYMKGEPFELNDAQIEVYYANGRRESFPLSFEMVSNYDPQEVGEHVLTINYENVITNIKINISNAPITQIEPVEGSLPYKTSYIESQDLNISNLFLKINYQSGDPDIIPVTEDMVSGYDRNIIGEQEVTITYLEEYSTSYTVQVRQKQVSNISINHPPNKELYLVNEKIEIEDLAGGELFISYDNGYTEYIDFEDLFENEAELDEALEYDTSLPVNREIVRMHYGGKSVIFDIRVLIKAADRFELINSPSGVQVVGTNLSLEGGELLIYYNNETTETVYMTDEKVSYSGYDKNTVGEQEITLSFSDISETYTFLIDVVDATPIELEILAPVLNNEEEAVPYSNVSETPKIQAPFYQESIIDLDIWEYRLKMDNDTYSDIYSVSQNMLQGDSSQLELEDYGMKTLTFSYVREDVEIQDEIEINVIQKLLDRITVTSPDNDIFYQNEPLVLTGATFTAYYNDGTVYSDDITIDMVSGYNNQQLGEQDVAVTYTTDNYGSKVATFRVLVIRKAIYIEFVSALKTEYVIGEQFSLDGLVMRIHYEGFGQPENFGGPFGEEWSFHNTQFDELGEHEVIVQYEAVGLVLDTVIPVTVRNEVLDIDLVRHDDDTYTPQTELPEVVAGLEIDLSELYLELTLENGVDYISLKKNMLDYQRVDRALGSREVTINYEGFSIVTSVEVIAKEISSLVLLQKPFREYYKSNEEQELEIEGLAMRLYFTNETNIKLNESRLTNQDNDSLEYEYTNQQGDVESVILSITELDISLDEGIDYETRTIEISIEEYSVSFDVIVAYRIATDITWDISEPGEEPVDQPEIIAYQGLNEIIFSDDMEFKVIFNEGEFNEIININDNLEDISIIGYNHNIAGVQEIDLRYQDILLSTIITVRQKDLLSIDFADDFYVPDVTEGMSLDLRQAKIEVTYYHDMGEEEDIVLPATTVSLSSSMIDYDRHDLNLGTRPIIISFTYKGTTTITETLLFNIVVEQKELLNIKMGTIPKTKYIELDPYEYHGGTVILYYNNDTTTTLNLSDAKRVVSSGEILPTDTFILNYGQFNNEDFSGFSRRQQIFITYIEGSSTMRTSYDIIMHDRMYMQVVFEESEYFNEEDDTYYFWYGEDREINYEILGYTEHTDQPEDSEMVAMDLEIGINYTFKYINVETDEEFGSWPKDAGEYMIYIHYDADSSVNNDRIHNSFEVNNRNLVIRPKNVHIIPDTLNKVYGENNPQFTSEFYAVEHRELADGSTEPIYHSENVFGYDETKDVLGEITYHFFDSGGTEIEIGRKTAIGVYTVTASIDEQRNYFVTIEDADFEILKREIVLMADSHEKEYGQPDPTFTYTTAAVMGNAESGLIEGDSFDGFLLRPNPSSNNNVGEYDILLVTPNNPNYEVQYVGNTLTIYKRNLYLTVGDYTKVYGEELPQFSVSESSDYTQAYAYDDSRSSLLGELEYICMDEDTPVGEETGVGVYDVMAEGLTSYNYEIIYNSGSLTIEKRQLQVQAIDAQKVYGEQLEEPLEYSLHSVEDVDESGIYGEDTLNGELERDAGEAVDEYAIRQGTLDSENNPNYDITFVNGIFTIIKRDAQIEILVSTREYDGQSPYILDEEYVVHNAHGDIKENITIIFGSNASSNVGTYRINFESTDENHNLSLLDPDGYWLQITRRQVRTEFFNIPYGQLIEGEYTGSVYKGSPYYYEARVKESDIVEGDNVSVTIQTASGEDPQDYDFENKNNVTNVGEYTVRAFNLSNNNYQLITPSEQEIEEDGDYRYTTFEIIPAEIKILITIEDMSKTYTGSEINFDNNLTEVEGYYQTNDYVLLTEIDFMPHGLNVYPYYINPQNDKERLPRVVKYSMTE